MNYKSFKLGFCILAVALCFSPSIAAQKALNDAEIAEILEVCQKIRYEFAVIAMNHSESEEVKDFAIYILTDYRDESSPIPQFARNPNQTARDLKRDVNALSKSLKLNKGSEFDAVYLQSQMDLHKRIMQDFKDNLIPAAKNPELKKTLAKVYDDMDSYVDETLDTYISVRK